MVMIDESELGKTIGGLTPQEWYAQFWADHEARWRKVDEAVARERRQRAALAAQVAHLSRRRGLLGWLGLR
jgi:hypothetical protein